MFVECFGYFFDVVLWVVECGFGCELCWCGGVCLYVLVDVEYLFDLVGGVVYLVELLVGY